MKRAAVLLLALAALLAAPAASARALRGLDSSLPHAGADVGNKGLLEDIAGAVSDAVDAVSDAVSQVAEDVETGVEVIADVIAAKLWDGEVCLYGNNCGMHCTHDSYDESDPLDKACYDHDRCLEGASTQDAICACDDTLVRDADAIASSDDGSDMARTAVSVRDGIATFGKTVHGCYF